MSGNETTFHPRESMFWQLSYTKDIYLYINISLVLSPPLGMSVEEDRKLCMVLYHSRNIVGLDVRYPYKTL